MVKYEDMFEAYYSCLRRKRGSMGAQKYFQGFEEDLIALTDEINSRSYQIGVSTAFLVYKPKLREIFAANFRDRIVHHYVIGRLEPLFEQMYDNRTFNCRKDKGVLYGVKMLRRDIQECSDGYTQDCWVMKMDLQGFFMSIDKRLLLEKLERFIEERYHGEDKGEVMWLTEKIVLHAPEKNCVRRSEMSEWDALPKNKSLFTCGEGLGMPIGNLTSQHFANFLLYGLDAYIDSLGFKHHGRYVDDFYVVSRDKAYMLESVGKIRVFLRRELHVGLHPDKFYIQHYSKGVAFTGAVIKFGRIYPARRTVYNFMLSIRELNKAYTREGIEKCLSSVNSYLGQLLHMDAYGVKRKVLAGITRKTWKKIYAKGSFRSLHQRRSWRCKEKVREENWLRVYYAKDLNDHTIDL